MPTLRVRLRQGKLEQMRFSFLKFWFESMIISVNSNVFYNSNCPLEGPLSTIMVSLIRTITFQFAWTFNISKFHRKSLTGKFDIHIWVDIMCGREEPQKWQEWLTRKLLIQTMLYSGTFLAKVWQGLATRLRCKRKILNSDSSN